MGKIKERIIEEIIVHEDLSNLNQEELISKVVELTLEKNGTNN